MPYNNTSSSVRTAKEFQEIGALFVYWYFSEISSRRTLIIFHYSLHLR